MSADLELPRIQVRSIKLHAVQEESCSSADKTGLREDGEDSISECRTPDSMEHKIPPALSCPPAPRKPITRRIASCKRKLLSEFEFFDIVNREEVDSFFRSNSFDINAAKRRRCPCKL